MFGGLFDGDDESAGFIGPANQSSAGRTTGKSHFLPSHEIARRGDSGFVGLLNQGATCYLNSLLQSMLLTPEFRSALYSLVPEEIGYDPQDDVIMSKDQAGGGEQKSDAADGVPESTSSPLAREKEKIDLIEIDDDTLSMILSMGFNLEQIQIAAKYCGSGASAERLLGHLLDGGGMNTGSSSSYPSKAFSEDMPGNLLDDDLFLTATSFKDITARRSELAYQNDAFFDDFMAAESDSIIEVKESAGGSFEKDFTESADSAVLEAPTSAVPQGASTEVKQEEKVEEKPKKKKMIIQLLKLFSELQSLDIEAISTRDLTDSFGWTGHQSSEQHDVHELNRILSSAIEDSLKGTSQENLISQVYGGTFENSIRCLSCMNKTSRQENFVDIPIFVSGFSSLAESLQSITSSELLQGPNQYSCDACHQRVDAERRTAIKALPPILTLSLLRFGFDYQQGRRTKIKSHFAFPNSIDLTPFVADELHGDCLYDLYSVVVHSGDAYGGHYRAYINAVADGVQEPKWLDFDDSKVKQVDPKVLESQFSGAESAYMLMYRKRGSVTSHSNEVPAFLKPYLSLRESLLGERRQAFDEAKNTVRFFIDIETHFKITDGGISESTLDPTKEIEIDGRKTVFELKQLIKQAYFDQGIPDPMFMKFQRRIGARADARFEAEPLNLDDSATVAESGLQDKGTYLCWNGVTICGNFWDKVTKCAQLEIVHVLSLTQSETFQLPISDNTILKSVKRLVADRLDTFPEDLFFVTFESNGPHLVDNDDFPLSSIIGNSLRPHIFVESRKETINDLWVIRKYMKIDPEKKLFVVDKCSGGWHAVHTVNYTPSMTLLELKVLIVQKLAEYDYTANFSPDEVRLRRALPADFDGALFLDETIEISRSGLTANSRIIIERGETISHTLIPVRYIFHGSNGLTTTARELTVNQSATILDVKTQIAKVYGKSAGDLKIYWMDVWENKGSLIGAKDDDALITLNGPEGTLAILSENGFSVWLEEKVVQEELWVFNVDQYFMRIPVLKPQTIAGTETKSLFHHVPPITSLSTPRYPTEHDTLHLATVTLPATTTCTGLKDWLFEKGYLSNGFSERKGIRFWLKGAPVPPQKEGTSLKKLHFKSGKRILIQILEEEDTYTPAQEEKRTVLYVHHRNPERQEFDLVREFFLVSGKTASWRQLLDQLSVASGIPVEHLLVAVLDRKKKVDGRCNWHVVDEERTWTEGAFLVDIFLNPFSVTDGDNLGLMDRRLDPLCQDRPAHWVLGTEPKTTPTDDLDAGEYVRTPSKMRTTQEAVLRINID